MGKLCLDDIKDWRQFEALAAAWFRCLPQIGGSSVKCVEVQSSGIGSDGGVDLVVHITLDDGILTVTRTYIVQCKFHEANISPAQLGVRSITDLITAHKACGYLLICKKMATNSLKHHFRMLTENCPFKYSYEIWSGEEFLLRLRKAPKDILGQFFAGFVETHKG
jgi:hypothetical protein